MHVSICVTVLNEAEGLEDLLASIAAQTVQPYEVVVADGGSTDSTLPCLHAWQQRLPLQLIEAPGANISRGRNLAIQASSGELIAVTDGGVYLPPNWLETLISGAAEADVIGGFFHAAPRTLFETALGAASLPHVEEVNPSRFLPSSRSIAFTREAWLAVGGYPEWLDYCEDVVFDLELRRRGYRFAFCPSASVAFRPRPSLRAFFKQYFLYARGDGKADLYAGRHFVRYATYAAVILALQLRLSGLWALLLPASFLYLRRPLIRLSRHWQPLSWPDRVAATLLVPVIRFVGDLGKMAGYPLGRIWRIRHPIWRARH